MKTIILAGGFGTRFSEETEKVPKPMIQIYDKPMLLHIMNIYAKYGHTDFGIALGYKADYIKEYFFKTSLDKLNLNINYDVFLLGGTIYKCEKENNFNKVIDASRTEGYIIKIMGAKGPFTIRNLKIITQGSINSF